MKLMVFSFRQKGYPGEMGSVRLDGGTFPMKDDPRMLEVQIVECAAAFEIEEAQ